MNGRKRLLQCGGLFALVLILTTPVIPSVEVSQPMQSLVVRLYDISSVRNTTLTLSSVDARHVLEILDSVNPRLNNATNEKDQYQVYASTVAALYPYGVFGNLTRDRAEKLVTFWYRVGPKHLTIPSLQDKNAFCLVSGNTTLTEIRRFTENLVVSILVSLGNTIASWLLLMLILGPVWLVELNPLSVLTILTIGVKIAGEIDYGKGSVSTLGIFGSKTWQGSVSGILPGPFSVWDQDALYGFTGIQIGWLSLKPETHYLGSAFVAGITEG